jgi:hypothetical protein
MAPAGLENVMKALVYRGPGNKGIEDKPKPGFKHSAMRSCG